MNLFRSFGVRPQKSLPLRTAVIRQCEMNVQLWCQMTGRRFDPEVLDQALQEFDGDYRLLVDPANAAVKALVDKMLPIDEWYLSRTDLADAA